MSRQRTYDVYIKPSAERDMDSLPKKVFPRVTSAILSLETSPRRRGCKKLRGREAYRLRVGDYRILYTVDDSLRRVEVVAAGHRRNVYG